MNKNAFDFIRNSLNRIADGIASSDGRYPVWDYKSLLELINTLEEEYKKNDGASARSSLQQTCNNLATDTISRQAAIDAVESMLRRKFGIGGDLAEITLAELPSAQPEIIRCKDCKYNATSKKCLNPNSFFLVPADDDYCSFAERRTDE